MQIWHLGLSKEEKLADTIKDWYDHAKQKQAEYKAELLTLQAETITAKPAPAVNAIKPAPAMTLPVVGPKSSIQDQDTLSLGNNNLTICIISCT